MRRQLLPLAALLLLTACPSTLSRQNALFPIVKATWPAVKADVDVALDNGAPPPAVSATIAQLEGAIDADDYELLRGIQFAPVQALAVQGVGRRVQQGTSQGVADSLLQRIEQFSEAVEVLSR